MSNPLKLPVVMTLAEVAAFMKLNSKTILNKMAAGTFLPLPFTGRPYRWRGDDVEKWYRGDYTDAVEKLRKAHRRRTAA